MSIIAFIKKLLAPHESQRQEAPIMMQTYTIIMESPITLPVSDQALAEYTSQDYTAVFSDEIKERAETIIAEFADYCSQLVPEDVAKDYSDQLVQK